MVKRSTVAFADLRQFLLDLGFTVRKQGKFWYFEHAPSETWFGFRPYRSNERVALIDLHHVRKHLDWRGVLSERAFDERMKKATA